MRQEKGSVSLNKKEEPVHPNSELPKRKDRVPATLQIQFLWSNGWSASLIIFFLITSFIYVSKCVANIVIHVPLFFIFVVKDRQKVSKCDNKQIPNTTWYKTQIISSNYMHPPRQRHSTKVMECVTRVTGQPVSSFPLFQPPHRQQMPPVLTVPGSPGGPASPFSP